MSWFQFFDGGEQSHGETIGSVDRGAVLESEWGDRVVAAVDEGVGVDEDE